jgi:serine/threonine-protein kinase
MITGHVPFEADNFMSILTLHLTQETPLMGPALAEVGAPPGLEMVVQRALAKDREQRFSSIDEMAQAILDADGGRTAQIPLQPVSPSRQLPVQPAGPARSRSRPWITAGRWRVPPPAAARRRSSRSSASWPRRGSASAPTSA